LHRTARLDATFIYLYAGAPGSCTADGWDRVPGHRGGAAAYGSGAGSDGGRYCRGAEATPAGERQRPGQRCTPPAPLPTPTEVPPVESEVLTPRWRPMPPRSHNSGCATRRI